MVASVPDLPCFDLPFVFTIIHGIGKSTKIKTGKASNDVRWTQGRCRGEGPNCQNNAQDHPFERSTAFRAPGLSVMEITHLDW